MENLEALTDLSKPDSMTVEFDGTEFDPRGGSGGPKTVSFNITVSNKDMPAFPGPTKVDDRDPGGGAVGERGTR